MKQEDINTLAYECISDFNFDCVLNFFAMFGDVSNPEEFWIKVPADVASSCSWWHKPLTREVLIETARDLLVSFLKDPKNDSDNPFDWQRGHGGFDVKVRDIDKVTNEIIAVELNWTPLSGEGWLYNPYEIEEG